MKDLIRASLAIIVTSGILMYVVSILEDSSSAGGGGTITVFNWGEYIDPELISQFEEESGITVVYETFDSNEAMMTKIEQGGRAMM